jgi:hypothetical protein
MDNVTPLSPPDEGLTRSDSNGGKRGMTDFDGLPVLTPAARAVELFGISRASAYRYAESGELPVKRLGGHVFIVRDRLRDLLEAA